MFVVIITAVIIVLLLQLATLVNVNVITFDPTAIIDNDVEAEAVLRRSQIVPSVIIPILLRKTCILLNVRTVFRLVVVCFCLLVFATMYFSFLLFCSIT